MIGWESDKLWSDAYLPQIRQIVGPLLLEPAPIEMDQQEATDLKILKARDMRIACRVRRPGYANTYPWEFTIRAARKKNATELEKILSGYGDLAFYGHANESAMIDRFFVIDLDWFRSVISYDQRYHRWLPANNIEKRKSNHDDSSEFVSYDIRFFPKELIVCSSHVIPYDSMLPWDHLRSLKQAA